MAKTHRTLLAQATGFHGRGAGVVRPAVEAVLAAAMALGLGQAGWHALNPDAASASAPEGTAPDDLTLARAPLDATPFAPLAGSTDVIALGQLDTLRVTGVRMAADPSRSGAILAMGDGRQQAFLVGQDILAGIRLEAVTRDGIVVAHATGTRMLTMPMAQATGLSQALVNPIGLATPVTAEASPAAFGPAEQAWLAATLRNPVLEGATVRGFRLAEDAPAMVTAAGLNPGDVIEAINGAPAGEPLAAIAAVQSGGPVTLTVRRSDGEAAALRVSLGAAASVNGATP